MAKRMQEQKGKERSVAKPKSTAMNLSSHVPTSSSSAGPIASTGPGILFATEKPESRIRSNAKSDAASSSQVRLQDAYLGGLMGTATGSLSIQKRNQGTWIVPNLKLGVKKIWPTRISSHNSSYGSSLLGRQVDSTDENMTTLWMIWTWRWLLGACFWMPLFEQQFILDKTMKRMKICKESSLENNFSESTKQTGKLVLKWTIRKNAPTQDTKLGNMYQRGSVFKATELPNYTCPYVDDSKMVGKQKPWDLCGNFCEQKSIWKMTPLVHLECNRGEAEVDPRAVQAEADVFRRITRSDNDNDTLNKDVSNMCWTSCWWSFNTPATIAFNFKWLFGALRWSWSEWSTATAFWMEVDFSNCRW